MEVGDWKSLLVWMAKHGIMIYLVIEGRQVFFFSRGDCWFQYGLYKCLSSIFRLVSLNNYQENNLVNLFLWCLFFDLRCPIFPLAGVMTTMHQTSIVVT